MKKISIFLIVITLTLIACHPSHNPDGENTVTCTNPQPAKIWSWHIHVLFMENDQLSVQTALQTRAKFIEKFNYVLNEESCKTFDFQNYNCMFDVVRGGRGPFPVSNWAVFLLPEYFEEMVTWMSQNRDGLDILIHPNSGCSIQDHSNWSLTQGYQWRLNMDIFGEDKPYSEDPFTLPEQTYTTEEDGEFDVEC